MSLNDLALSPYLLTELYGKLLVESDAKNKKVARAKKVPNADVLPDIPAERIIKFSGTNKKNILVAVSEEIHSFLSDADLQFLSNVLSACGVSMNDTALINCFNEPLAISKNLDEQFAPQVIIFLGTAPHLLGFPVEIPQYRIGRHNGQKYLCAPQLKKIAADQSQKKLLWNALQELFDLPK